MASLFFANFPVFSPIGLFFEDFFVPTLSDVPKSFRIMWSWLLLEFSKFSPSIISRSYSGSSSITLNALFWPFVCFGLDLAPYVMVLIGELFIGTLWELDR